MTLARRAFITLLSGAGAWPLAAPAHSGQLRCIGVLMRRAAQGRQRWVVSSNVLCGAVRVSIETDIAQRMRL
jgi:hypothetical protein